MAATTPSPKQLNRLEKMLEDAWKKSKEMPLLRSVYALGFIAVFVLILIFLAGGKALHLTIGVVVAVALLFIVTLAASAAERRNAGARQLEALLWICTVAFGIGLSVSLYWFYLTVTGPSPAQSTPSPRAIGSSVQPSPQASASTSISSAAEAAVALARRDHLEALDNVLRTDAENWRTVKSKVEQYGRVSHPDATDEGKADYENLWQVEKALADDLGNHFPQYRKDRGDLLESARTQDRGVRALRLRIRGRLPSDLDNAMDRDSVAEGVTRRCLGKKFEARLTVEGGTGYQVFGDGGGSGPMAEEQLQRLRKAIAVLDGAVPSGELRALCDTLAIAADQLASKATALTRIAAHLAEQRGLKGDS